MGIRVGTGFDAHRFAEGRKLILGGVEIPFELGLEAHSDGDVAVHALMDALLGAAGLPDIGRLFPDNDPAYEGACSRGSRDISTACARRYPERWDAIPALWGSKRPRPSTWALPAAEKE